MNELKQIWCELMTQEEVLLLERLLMQMNIDPMCRPVRWAKRPTDWMRENRERKPGEDPMAVVYITIEEDKTVWIDSAYRFGEEGYTQVTPSVMHTILTAMLLWGEGKIGSSCLSKEK